MSDKLHLRKKDDHEYVDIHGRDIPAVIIAKTGEVAFPLSELKQTGVTILKKSQYSKLPTINKQFDDDFNMFMLESAKKYMLENQIAIPENVIVSTINNCKKLLPEKKPRFSANNFFKDRFVEQLSDNEILIQVNVSNVSPTSTPSPIAGVSRKTSTPNFSRKSPKTPIFIKDSEKTHDDLDSTPRQHSRPQVNGQRNFGQSKVPKLLPPNNLDKIDLEEDKQRFHDVVVTCIHKRNCIWVTDKANEELFNKIHVLVNEEAKYQKPAQKPWQLEKVYLAREESCWFRCKIMRFTPLTVFFLDYGNVAEVEEIRDVSEDLAKVPCMAVRLTFKEAEYDPCLEDEIKIKIIKKNEDTTYFVNVLKQTKKEDMLKQPRKQEDVLKQPGKQEDVLKQPRKQEDVLKQIEKPEDSPRDFFKIPPPLTCVENGQTVVVIHVENGFFHLRTKECFQKLKAVERKIEDYVKSAQPINTIKVDQLVLAPHKDDDKYYRAVVTEIKHNKIDVKYLDYPSRVTVDKDSLKNINESLSLEPVTYFQTQKLKGFENRDFSEDAQNLIQGIIKMRKKFAVVLNDEGQFDLYDRSMYLSQQLQQAKESPSKVRLQDMNIYKPEFNVKTYLCGFFKNSHEFSLVPSEELESYIDSVLINDIQDLEPYTPEEGEVCFCYYTDTWYRCLVTRVLNSDYEVVLLDFGNVELIKKKDLRKPSDKITNVPVLALPCRLINLPDHPKVEDLLKNMIIEGELYNVDVKNINDGKYSVEIPSVYERIINS